MVRAFFILLGTVVFVGVSQAADPAFYELPIDFRNLYQGSCSWGDFDEDGDADILLSGLHTTFGSFNSTPETKVFRNDRNRTFTDLGLSLKGLYNGPVTWADVDSDGNLDIMITGSDKSSRFTKIYRWFSDEGNRRFEEISHPFPDISGGSISWADFDGDGDQDLLLAGDLNTPGSIAALYESRPDGTFEQPWRRAFDQTLLSDLLPAIPSLSGPLARWFDYNVDGRPDIIISGERAIERTPYLGLFRNTGSGFVEVTDSGLPQVDANSITWADYDNDGEPDLLLQGTSAGGAVFARVFRNRFDEISDVEFVEHAINFSQFANLSGLGTWGDFNADGYKDFIAGGSLSVDGVSDTATRVFFSNVSLAFAPGSLLGGISDSLSMSCVEPTDYDGDGDLDLFISGNVGQIAVASVFESYRKAAAAGVVLNGASTGLSGVTVRLIDANGMTTTATTDLNGAYRFENLLWGQYTIEPVADDVSFSPATLALNMTDVDSLANNFVGASPTVPEGQGPDLKISSVTHSAMLNTGEQTRVILTVTNKEADKDNSLTWARTISGGLYLSADKAWDGSDLVFKLFRVGLGSSKQKTVVLQPRVSSKLKKGKRYYLIAVADPANAVVETNESNNVKVSGRAVKRR